MEIKSVTCRAKVKNWKELEAIVSELKELDIKIDELNEKMDSDNFCKDCPYAKMTHNAEEYWGSKVNREYVYCNADFDLDPSYIDCARHNEYHELNIELCRLVDKFEELVSQANTIVPNIIAKDSDGEWDYDCSSWVYGELVKYESDKLAITSGNRRVLTVIDSSTIGHGIVFDNDKEVYDGDYIRMVAAGDKGNKVYYIGTIVCNMLNGISLLTINGELTHISNIITEAISFNIVGNKYDGYYYKNAYIPESKEELIALINGKVPLDRINTIKITDMSRLFAYTNRDDYSGIETWDTRNVTDMSYMFYCANASSPTIAGIANWNTSEVVNMSSMFAYSDFDCNISKWDVSNVSNMSSMFYACPFSYDISNWNIKSLAIAKQMFDKKYKHSLIKWFINDLPEPSIIVNSLNTYFGADIVKDDKDGK